MGAVHWFRQTALPAAKSEGEVHNVKAPGTDAYIQYIINNEGVAVPPAVLAHGHAMSDIVGLSAALSAKANVVTLTAGDGLTGGGDTSANRSFSVDLTNFNGRVRGATSYVLPAIGAANTAYNSGPVEAYVSAVNFTAGARPGYGFHAMSNFGAYLYANSESDLRLRGLTGTDFQLWHSGNNRSNAENDARYALAGSISGYVANTPVSTDWNTVNSDAKAKFNTSAVNSANGNNMHGLFIPHASLSNFGSAIMFRAGLGYFRSLESGTWGAWQEFAPKSWVQAYVTGLGYTSNAGTVTNVGLVTPTGFSVLSSPVNTSGNLQFGFTAGYSLPTTAKQSEWDAKLSPYSTTGENWSTISGDARVKFNTSSNNSPETDLIVHGMYIPHNNFGNYGSMLAFRSGIGYFQSIENGVLSGWKTIADRDYVTSRGYIVGINSGMVTTALGYTPLSTVTYSHVVNALGYDPLRNDRTISINGWTQNLRDNPTYSVGTVTSVGLVAPTGFNVLSSAVTGSGNLQFGFASGYALPTTSQMSSWNNRAISLGAQMNSIPKILNNSLPAELGVSNIYDNGSTVIVTGGFEVSSGNLEISSSNRALVLSSMVESQLGSISGLKAGMLAYVPSGSGHGFWGYFGASIGWRIFATRVWVDGGGAP